MDYSEQRLGQLLKFSATVFYFVSAESFFQLIMSDKPV
jgi:hypothetical protein